MNRLQSFYLRLRRVIAAMVIIPFVITTVPLCGSADTFNRSHLAPQVFSRPITDQGESSEIDFTESRVIEALLLTILLTAEREMRPLTDITVPAVTLPGPMKTVECRFISPTIVEIFIDTSTAAGGMIQQNYTVSFPQGLTSQTLSQRLGPALAQAVQSRAPARDAQGEAVEGILVARPASEQESLRALIDEELAGKTAQVREAVGGISSFLLPRNDAFLRETIRHVGLVAQALSESPGMSELFARDPELAVQVFPREVANYYTGRLWRLFERMSDTEAEYELARAFLAGLQEHIADVLARGDPSLLERFFPQDASSDRLVTSYLELAGRLLALCRTYGVLDRLSPQRMAEISRLHAFDALSLAVILDRCRYGTLEDSPAVGTMLATIADAGSVYDPAVRTAVFDLLRQYQDDMGLFLVADRGTGFESRFLVEQEETTGEATAREERDPERELVPFSELDETVRQAFFALFASLPPSGVTIDGVVSVDLGTAELQDFITEHRIGLVPITGEREHLITRSFTAGILAQAREFARETNRQHIVMTADGRLFHAKEADFAEEERERLVRFTHNAGSIFVPAIVEGTGDWVVTGYLFDCVDAGHLEQLLDQRNVPRERFAEIRRVVDALHESVKGVRLRVERSLRGRRARVDPAQSNTLIRILERSDGQYDCLPGAVDFEPYGESSETIAAQGESTEEGAVQEAERGLYRALAAYASGLLVEERSEQIQGVVLDEPVPQRHVVIPDVHGNLEGVLLVLFASRAIELTPEGDLTLSPGTTLVIMGDSIDRGHQSREIDRLFRQLQRQAEENPAAGSTVIRLLGNHELMMIQAVLSAETVFADERMRTWIANGGAATLRELGLSADTDPAELRASMSLQGFVNDLVKDIEAGHIVAAYDAGGRIGVHAGVSRKVSGLITPFFSRHAPSASELRSYLNGQLPAYVRYLRGELPAHRTFDILFGSDGIFWVTYDRLVREEAASTFVKQFGAHTPDRSGAFKLSPAEKVMGIDIDTVDGHKGYLSLEGDRASAYRLRQKAPDEMTDEDRAADEGLSLARMALIRAREDAQRGVLIAAATEPTIPVQGDTNGSKGESVETIATQMEEVHILYSGLYGPEPAYTAGSQIVIPEEILSEEYRPQLIEQRGGLAQDIVIVPFDEAVRLATNKTDGAQRVIILDEALAQDPRLGPNCLSRQVVLRTGDSDDAHRARRAFLALEGAIGMARAVIAADTPRIREFYRLLTGEEINDEALRAAVTDGVFTVPLPSAEGIDPNFYRDLMERAFEFLKAA